MKNYHHLSLEEREKIYALKTAGKSLRSIARTLGRPHTTISRELGRNAKYGRPYIPCRADRLTKKRGEKQRFKAPLKCPLVFLYVRKKLRDPKKRWSPETIAGRLPLDHPGYSIGVETIYRYIHHRKYRRYQLWQYLLRQHKKRAVWHGRKAKKMVIPASFSIINRPQEVEDRLVPGHWETDNMEGKRSDLTAVSVTVDRTARLTHLSKLNDHTSSTKTKVVVNALKPYPKQLKKSLTCDRGPENRKYQVTGKKLNTQIFFCNAYHSWEKGTVENTVGRVRRFFPKGTSLDQVTQKQLRKVERILNNTPRKCLGFLTPYERMRQITNQQGGALPVRM